MTADTGWHLYRSYKSGTKHVVQWLANAARQRCDISLVMPKLCETSPSSGSWTKTREFTIKLSAADLLTLAKALLGENRSTLPPPDGLDNTITVLATVISGRQESTSWYQQSNPADDRHHHFIRVLETLASILRKIRKGSRKPDRRNYAPISGVNSPPANSFHVLEAEEPSESSNHLQKSRPTLNDQDIQPHTEVELENRDFDRDFALYCTLKESHDVRCSIKQVWSARHHGPNPVSLAIASQLTNNALILLLANVDEFAEEFPELQTFDEIAKYAEVQLEVDQRGAETFSCRTEIFEGSSNAISPYTLLCMPSLRMLHLLRMFNGEVAPKDWQDALMHIQAQHQLGHDIVCSLAELIELYKDEKRRALAFSHLDVFTQLYINFMLSDEPLPIALVFALQTQMDIYDALEGMNCHEAIDMSIQAERLKLLYATFSDSALARADYSLLGGAISRSPKHKLILHMIQHGIRSPLCERSGVSLPLYGEDGGNKMSAWLLRSPTLSGHLNRTLCELAHSDGIDVCNKGLVVHSLAHIFRALRTISPKVHWPDMDWIIARLGSKAFGLFEPANSGVVSGKAAPLLSMEASARCFGLSLGVKLSKYATNRRLGKQGCTTRIALPPSTICLSRTDRLKNQSLHLRARDQFAPTAKNLNLSQTTRLRTTCHQSARTILLGSLNSKERKRVALNDSLSTVQVLAALQSQSNEEQPDMCFNFHIFFSSCLVIMDAIVIRYKQLKKFQVKEISGMMFYEIVDDLLWEAADAEAAGRTSSTLLAIARAFSGSLESDGDGQIGLLEGNAVRHEKRRKVRGDMAEELRLKKEKSVYTADSRFSIRGCTLELVPLWKKEAVGSSAEREKEMVRLLL